MTQSVKYTENQLFEQSAIRLFVEAGWTTVLTIQLLRSTRHLLPPRLLLGKLNLGKN